MKKLTFIFWSLVGVIGIAFAGTIVTAVKQKQAKEEAIQSAPAIPPPALPNQ